MKPPETVDAFLDALEESSLLKSKLFTKLLRTIQNLKKAPSTADGLARMLVHNQMLTEFQAVQLLRGETKCGYLNKYKLLTLLARGGMGKVYLAEQLTVNRLVAVKVIRPRKTTEKVSFARFRREAQILAALQHPNIVQAHDFDEERGIPYIVMEFIEGINLRDYVEKLGTLRWQEAAHFLAQTALGLNHAHEMGVIHRDIKPSNIMIDSTGTAKILDLGIVTSLSDQKENHRLTTMNDQLGSVDFLAPEQATSSLQIDRRSDIYSLAAVFYYLVTGSPIVTGQTNTEKLLSYQSDSAPSLKTVLPEMDLQLAEYLDRMLDRNPEERPESAQEVAEFLFQFASCKTPPYDLNAITFAKKDYLPLLNLSPSLSSLREHSGTVLPDYDKDLSDEEQHAKAASISLEDWGATPVIDLALRSLGMGIINRNHWYCYISSGFET